MPNSFPTTSGANAPAGELLAEDPMILAWQRLAVAKKNDADKNALIEVRDWAFFFFPGICSIRIELVTFSSISTVR
jgi:hypothetical protein